MTFVTGLALTVDTAAWRTHLQQTVEAAPGLVPVAKGNGYGFGLRLLAGEAQRLGVSCLAVGQPAEVDQVRDVFDGDIVVLQPLRPDDPRALELTADPRVITTVSRLTDLEMIANLSDARPRVLIEMLTSMKRHGMNAGDLAGASSLFDHVEIDGWTIHLPLAGHTADEARELAGLAAGLRVAPLWFSHLPHAEARRISADTMNTDDIHLRMGTKLWLGAPETREVTATVLDLHRVKRGEKVGYHQRRIHADGWLVVVAGGTSNGIAMEAPTSATTVRQRMIAVASGGLEATGRSLSPYTIAGRKRWFVEPPHMQSSLLFLPGKEIPPKIGEEVPVEVRLTTALVDEVVLN